MGFIERYRESYYLVGGTAIALQIGHRKSIDYDLFTDGTVSRLRLKKQVSDYDAGSTMIYEDVDQIHFITRGVKLTFFSYPYDIEHKVEFEGVITMPTLLSLAAMKAFTLGRRAKWKDYVDLYFLLRDRFSLETICAEADRLFGSSFSPRLFRGQLAYHKDIDYGESIDYMQGYVVAPETVRAFLIEKSLEGVIDRSDGQVQ
ncbi:MAG: nucleotidyl transferase AbiEii/AbiGii toxin family protein [Coriobacteriales bacterium]|nr:nucleotidyl transferase AbiEii/AbiGii toxin family protein [Coriobacteriales bacterium]